MGIHWFLFFITAIILIIQGFVSRKFGTRRLSYRRYFSTNACFQGDEIEMVEQIANRKLLPVPWLRLESLLHASLKFERQQNLDINDGHWFQNHKSFFFSLLPYTQITRRHRVVCLRRGCYRLHTASLTTGDVMGLHKTTLQVDLDAELLVYPSIANAGELNLPASSWHGDMTVRRWIVDDPFLISGVRPYRFGDPMKGINWKATARIGSLQVHNHDYTAENRFMIYLNVEDHENMWDKVENEDLIEKGISYAAAVAQQSVDSGMEVGFGSNAHLIDATKKAIRIEPARGSDQMNALLETMARMVVARSIPFDTFLEEEALRARTRQDILIITTFVSSKMQAPIEQLRYDGNTVEIIVLKDETSEKRKAGAGT